jgi:cell division transport system permease protein
MTPLERAWRGGRSDWRLHALSIFSVSVAFVCMAASLLVVENVRSLCQTWAKTGRASVYLRADAKREAVSDIEAALRSTDNVRAVRYVSAEEAQRELLSIQSESVLAELPNDAFPASLEVTLDDDANASRIEHLADTLGALPAVESVETYKSWTSRLASVLRAAVLASALLAAVVFAAVVSVVASTIRLTLQRRRIEVEVLKLVGATDEYVGRPFVIEGAVQGAFGSLVAIALVLALYMVVRSRFDAELAVLVGVTPRLLPCYACLALIFTGGALGAIAAHASLRRLLAAG